MYNKRVVIPCEVPIREVYNIATRYHTGFKESQFYSLPFGQAVASMY